MCVPILPISKPKAPQPSIRESAKVKDVPFEQREARREDRRRAQRSYGRRSTILTAQSGLSAGGSTKKKTLLGE